MGDELGSKTIDYSPVGSSKTSMERQFRLILASGHCLDPALYWRFMNRHWRFVALSLIEYLLPQFSVFHQWFRAVRGYPPTVCRCFVGVSPVLPML
ncbi:hypothetical protein HAX54_011407 [Datura stramonium]|uniref:Uncharacterized protein n=1 Tax=Datura stramonium TaxID=4076 RepID=A0ABS8THY5_DATST|nr:hypothetical protein [Datura stramonium]